MSEQPTAEQVIQAARKRWQVVGQPKVEVVPEWDLAGPFAYIRFTDEGGRRHTLFAPTLAALLAKITEASDA